MSPAAISDFNTSSMNNGLPSVNAYSVSRKSDRGGWASSKIACSMLAGEAGEQRDVALAAARQCQAVGEQRKLRLTPNQGGAADGGSAQCSHAAIIAYQRLG